MKILGVDPGTLRTGVGLIEAQGSRYSLLYTDVIKAKPSLPLSERLYLIYQGLAKVIREHRPDVTAIENVFFGQDLKAMVKIGEARACAMIAAAEFRIPVCEYPPASVKVAVSGNGRATKQQIQQMIKRLLNLKALPPSDGADAIAVAICHLHSGGSLKTGKSKSGTWTEEDLVRLQTQKGLRVISGQGKKVLCTSI